MKINSIKSNFAEGMQIIQSAVSPRTTLPVLQNFLIETENSKVKIVFTDLEMAVRYYIKADVQSGGSITVPAKKFLEILHSLKDNSDVTLTVNDANRININCDKSNFWIIGTPKDEYPKVPEMDKKDAFEVPVLKFAEMIKKTIFAASTEETRYVLNGILLTSTASGLDKTSCTKKDYKVVIPVKILQEVVRYVNTIECVKSDKITIAVSSNQIGFQINETTFISRLIDGNFPNYEHIIPNKKEIQIEVLCSELLAITKRAALCVSDKGGSVKYSINKDILRVNAVSQNMEFKDEILISYAGEEFNTAFNPQFIIDVLKNINSEKISLGLNTPVNPVLIEPVGEHDCRYIIMPVRV